MSSFKKKNKLSLVVQKLTTFQVFIIEYNKIKHIILISRTRYTYSCSSRSYITMMECKKSLKCLYESKVILLRIASCLDPPLKSNNWNNLHTCVSFKLFTPQKPDKFLRFFFWSLSIIVIMLPTSSSIFVNQLVRRFELLRFGSKIKNTF